MFGRLLAKPRSLLRLAPKPSFLRSSPRSFPRSAPLFSQASLLANPAARASQVSVRSARFSGKPVPASMSAQESQEQSVAEQEQELRDNVVGPGQSAEEDRVPGEGELPYLYSSGYWFTDMKSDPKEVRDRLSAVCDTLPDVKGNLAIASEGINVALSGVPESVHALEAAIQAEPDFQGVRFKHSWGSRIGFFRMLIKVRSRLVPAPASVEKYINPDHEHKITPKELSALLDSGEKVILVDTRNDYEYEVGTFKNAVVFPEMKHFVDFTEFARQKLADVPKDTPVVAFCTGGIRCEKALPALHNIGFKEAKLLEGGILKYFEETNFDEKGHWEGSCFVFDRRISINRDLSESGLVACFICRASLTPEDLKSADFVEGESCPKCVGQDGLRRGRQNKMGDEFFRKTLNVPLDHDGSDPLELKAAKQAEAEEKKRIRLLKKQQRREIALAALAKKEAEKLNLEEQKQEQQQQQQQQ